MTNALTYGAAASDIIVLVGNGLTPSTPVGTQAPNPVSVQVLQADGITPVIGATVGWTASKAAAFFRLRRSLLLHRRDRSKRTGIHLAHTYGRRSFDHHCDPGTWHLQSREVAERHAQRTESASDIGVLTQSLWISSGATISIPLTARVLSGGSPQNNAPVSFSVVKGSGTLSANSMRTDSNGNATVTISVAQISSTVQVSACVAPRTLPASLSISIPLR